MNSEDYPEDKEVQPFESIDLHSDKDRLESNISPSISGIGDPIPESPVLTIDNQGDKDKKIEMHFRLYAILTFWLLTSLLSVISVSLNGTWLLFIILGVYLDVNQSKISNGIRSFLFFFIKILYGVKFEGDGVTKHRVLRFWWFFSFGHLIAGLIQLLLGQILVFIIPALFIIWKHKKVLRFMFIISFLPKSQYVHTKSEKDRRYQVEKFDHLSFEDRQYLAFNPPTLLTHIVAVILILLSPVIISFQILPITFAVTQSTKITYALFDQAMFYVPWGIIAIIPYLVLGLPIFKGKRLANVINTSIAAFITRTLATTGLNAIPFFKGEYFLERESDLIDMRASTGIFEVFKRGRLFSIIVTPLAIISLLLKYTITNIDNSIIANTEITPLEFINQFNDFMRNDTIVLFFILVVVPISITIILTLIWSINDAEIKRASWRNIDEDNKIEISSVEDLGKSLDNIFKLVIGVSAISNLASSISIMVTSNDVIGWTLAMLILTLIAMVVLPGTITMAYIYFASGDHVRGVNCLRYHLSRENRIAVGTISRDYKDETILVYPSDKVYIKLHRKPSEDQVQLQ